MNDKMINKFIKRFIKRRPFKQVKTIGEADLILTFDPNNTERVGLITKEEYDFNNTTPLPSDYRIFYFKSTNPKDTKQTTMGFMKQSGNIMGYKNF